MYKPAPTEAQVLHQRLESGLLRYHTAPPIPVLIVDDAWASGLLPPNLLRWGISFRAEEWHS
jgi:hypothetical protein